MALQEIAHTLQRLLCLRQDRGEKAPDMNHLWPYLECDVDFCRARGPVDCECVVEQDSVAPNDRECADITKGERGLYRSSGRPTCQ